MYCLTSLAQSASLFANCWSETHALVLLGQQVLFVDVSPQQLWFNVPSGEERKLS